MNSKRFDDMHEARMQFLHSAAYAAFKVCPQLSAYYGNMFADALGGQRAANYVYRTMCPYCGSLLVDGRSVSRVSVVRSPTPAARAGKRGGGGRAKTPGGTAGRRVIKVHLTDSNATDSERSKTKGDRAEARRNVRNTVEYLCQLCDSRIVFAGSTKTQLQAAGLDVDTRKTALKMADLSLDATPAGHGSAALSAKASDKTEIRPKAKAMQTVKPAPATVAQAAFVPPDSASTKSKQSSGAGTPVLVAKAPLPAADTQQDKKRKRQKSNLLAVVAANKKKSEAKKEAENSSFSLSDFLSNL
ncbi:hypothetical protein GGF42_008822 [Coemansia sp. RSA 2424]|nr:hypothetical protein GGF42_008822 [Coemansia sp. RSA 2424]